MKDIKWYRVWDIVYPVGIYYVLMNVATFVVCLIVPLTDESYGFIKVLTTLFVLPVVYVMYRNDQLRRGVQKAKAKELLFDMRSEIVPLLGILVMAACAAVVLNNLIAWTPLMKVSATYQSVTRKFFGGAVIFEILGPCILVPVLEEYVFRGLVYKRLREWLGMTWAVVISAIIFGMMHMNIVQFVYAGFLGVFLALCVERTKHLYGAILAHMAANTISVIRTETNWLSWMDESLQAQTLTTVGMGLVFIGLYLLVFWKGKGDGKKII